VIVELLADVVGVVLRFAEQSHQVVIVEPIRNHRAKTARLDESSVAKQAQLVRDG
jgi:hypothetical protein